MSSEVRMTTHRACESGAVARNAGSRIVGFLAGTASSEAQVLLSSRSQVLWVSALLVSKPDGKGITLAGRSRQARCAFAYSVP